MVHLVCYNVLGRLVRTLINQDLTAGYHKAVWDATDDLGRPLSGGLYIYRVQAGGFSEAMKMVLLT
jgi:flagellar hook assembly protein FlgD